MNIGMNNHKGLEETSNNEVHFVCNNYISKDTLFAFKELPLHICARGAIKTPQLFKGH